MLLNEVLVKWEKILKQYQCIKFDKIWERFNDGYKMIYIVWGLTVNDSFIPHTKFIFWSNKEKDKITENVISYLYSLNCDYKSIPLEDDKLQHAFDFMIDSIKLETSNKELIKFIIDGTEPFNKQLKLKNVNDFVNTLELIPNDITNCVDTTFDFKLSFNNKNIIFKLKPINKEWSLYSGEEKHIIGAIKNTYETLIDDIIRNNI